MYYHKPRDRGAVPAEGAVRFRLAKNTPGAFGRGRDPRHALWVNWQIMLPYIARLPKHAALRDQLLAEKLVTEQQVLQCRDLFADEKIVPETTLFRLRQAFPVFRFLRCRPAHYGYRGSSVPLRSCRRLSFRRRSRKIPWSGVGVAHFEPAKLPEYGGRRMLHLHVKHAHDVHTILKGSRFNETPGREIAGIHTPRGVSARTLGVRH
ncbi:hypothetical protein B0H14DRAFT_801699 [Mycena olivaceomarginata]|nr:hypothetical protein B0H14DRAFT_801699 [Mycena olivaceomarginata]